MGAIHLDAWLVAVRLVCINQRETKVNLIANNLIPHDNLSQEVSVVHICHRILIVPNFNVRILGGGLLFSDGKVAGHYCNSVVAVLGILGAQHTRIIADSLIGIRANVSDRAKVVFIDQSIHRAGKHRIIFAYHLRFVIDSDSHSSRFDLKCNISASQVSITSFGCLDAHSHKTIINIGHTGSISSPISTADLVVNGVAVSTAYAGHSGMRVTVIRPLAALSGQKSAAGRGLDLKVAFLYDNIVIGIISVLGIQHVRIGANSFNILVRANVSDLAKVARVNQIRRNRAGERGIVITKELSRIVDLDRHLFRRDRQRAFNLVDVIVGRICTSVQCILKSVFCRFGTDIRRRAGDAIRRALALNKTVAGNGDLMLGQGIAVVNLLVAGGGQGHIALGDLNGVLGRFCLIAFLLSRDLDPKFTDVFKLRHTIIICVCAVLSILGLVGQRCTIGICCHCVAAAMRLAVILAGIVRSGKRHRLGRDLACGDGEVNRTVIDRQCGLAVQGHVAVLISHSGLGIDGDGVGLLPSIDGLFNTVFCFCILHSFISIEFPLANEAVISRHTGGQAVGHSTAVQAADDILRDRRKSVHQALSVAGIVGVSLVARLRCGNLVFQIVADCNFLRVCRIPKVTAGLIIVIRNLLSACTKADGIDRCVLLQVRCGTLGILKSILVATLAIIFDLVVGVPNCNIRLPVVAYLSEIICRLAIGKDNNVL